MASKEVQICTGGYVGRLGHRLVPPPLMLHIMEEFGCVPRLYFPRYSNTIAPRYFFAPTHLTNLDQRDHYALSKDKDVENSKIMSLFY